MKSHKLTKKPWPLLVAITKIYVGLSLFILFLTFFANSKNMLILLLFIVQICWAVFFITQGLLSVFTGTYLDVRFHMFTSKTVRHVFGYYKSSSIVVRILGIVEILLGLYILSSFL